MKNLRYIVPALLFSLAATASLQAGPGADYFKRVETVSASAKAAQAPASQCKVTEIVRVTTGPHGIPTHQVVDSKMDCSSCNDSSMACCAKTKS
jgi:hypothetical protein